MRVVSNTSPISNLAIIGRLPLLRRRYECVTIPREVERELAALTHADGHRATQEALAAGWIRIAERTLGLTVAGLLGELLHARLRGWIPSLRADIRRLRSEAGFFIDAEIETFLISQVEE
jgi:predicted nucleic acid-binding protein